MNRKIFPFCLAVALLFMMTVASAAAEKEEATPTPAPAPGAKALEAGGDETEPAVLAGPEEYMKNLEAQRRAIAREQEALMTLRAEVKADVEKLLVLQKKMDERLKVMDEEEAKRLKRLVQIYSAMSPDEIVARLAMLDDDLQLKILSGLKAKQQAQVLAAMPPGRAAELSKKLVREKY